MVGVLSAISGLFTTGINALTERSKQKSELKRQDISNTFRLKQAKLDSQIKRVESGDIAAISLDQLSFEHRGWKDEYLLIFTTMPVLILFIAPIIEVIFINESYVDGDLASAVMSGFDTLDKTPDWYLIALLLVVIDTLGFRRLLRGVLERKLGSM